MIGGPQPYTFDRVVRMVLSAALVIGLFALLRYLADVLLPFAAAVVLAYFLNPLVNVFEERLKRRGLAVAFTLVALVIIGLSFSVILAPLVFSQVTRFENSLGQLRADLVGAAPAPLPTASAPTSLPVETTRMGLAELMSGWEEFRRDLGIRPRAERFRRLQSRVAETYVGDVLGATSAYVRSDAFRTETLPGLVSQVFAGGVSVVGFAVQLVLGVTGAVLVLMYLFFLLLDFPEFAANWQGFLPPAYRSSITDFLKEFDVALRRYFRGQFVVSACTAALFSVGFTLIGLPMAVPFGLFVGLLNMVPYLSAISLLPALFLALIRSVETGGSLAGSIALVLLVYASVQVLQDTTITPRVMGKVTGLRPVAILLGVFIWGKLLGFLGLILAIPLTCLFIAYYRRFVLQQVRQEQAATGGSTGP